jgi:hypothetical protein
MGAIPMPMNELVDRIQLRRFWLLAINELLIGNR